MMNLNKNLWFILNIILVCILDVVGMMLNYCFKTKNIFMSITKHDYLINVKVMHKDTVLWNVHIYIGIFRCENQRD